MTSLYVCCLPSILHTTTQLLFCLFKVNQAISFPYWNSSIFPPCALHEVQIPNHGFKTLSDLTSAPASSQISLPFSHYISATLAHGQFLEMAKSFPTSEPLLRSYLNLESCPLIPTRLASSHLTSQVSAQMTPCHRQLYWSLWVISVHLASLYYRIPLTFFYDTAVCIYLVYLYTCVLTAASVKCTIHGVKDLTYSSVHCIYNH